MSPQIVTLSALQGTHVNYIWYTIRQLAVHRPWQYGPDVVSPDDIESVVTTIVRTEVALVYLFVYWASFLVN